MKQIVVHQKERVGAWIAQRCGRNSSWGDFEAIGIEQDGELLGGFLIDQYVKGARCSFHAAGIKGKWMTRRLIVITFRYVFFQLGCKVIVTGINTDNSDSMNAAKKIGFTEVARVPGGGGTCDLALFAMQKTDCKWLELKRG